MMMAMSMAPKADTGKGKHVKVVVDRAASIWTRKELWGTEYPMEEEVPLPWATSKGSREAPPQPDGNTTPMDACS